MKKISVTGLISLFLCLGACYPLKIQVYRSSMREVVDNSTFKEIPREALRGLYSSKGFDGSKSITAEVTQNFRLKLFNEPVKTLRINGFFLYQSIDNKSKFDRIFIEFNTPFNPTMRSRFFLAELTFTEGGVRIEPVIFDSAKLISELIHDIRGVRIRNSWLNPDMNLVDIKWDKRTGSSAAHSRFRFMTTGFSRNDIAPNTLELLPHEGLDKLVSALKEAGATDSIERFKAEQKSKTNSYCKAFL